MEIDLQRTVLALSDALDFVGVDEVHHGKRVALMAAGIARALAWEDHRIGDLVYAGVLHDCGVSRQLEHRELTATLEWDGAQAHCLRGEQFLLACPPLARFAPIVRWHHTRWEELPREGLAERDRLAANLVCLADRTDVLLAPYVHEDGLKSDILWEHDAIVERIAALSGVLFAPDLVAAFRRVAATEAFWLGLDPGYVDDELEDQLRGTPPVRLSTRTRSPSRSSSRAPSTPRAATRWSTRRASRGSRATSAKPRASPARRSTSSRSPRCCTTSASCASPRRSSTSRGR